SNLGRDVLGQISYLHPGETRRVTTPLQGGLPLHKACGRALQFLSLGITIRPGPVTPVLSGIRCIPGAHVQFDTGTGAVLAPPGKSSPTRKYARIEWLG